MLKKAIYKLDIGYYEIVFEDDILFEFKKIEEPKLNVNNRSYFSDKVIEEINEYLSGERKTFDIKLKLIGTPFQQQVWKTLCEIPYGETRSYKDIAIKINNIKAYRAVGQANNKNPIAIIVPCHRVIGSNNQLIGYASGLLLKEKLLKLEKMNK